MVAPLLGRSEAKVISGASAGSVAGCRQLAWNRSNDWYRIGLATTSRSQPWHCQKRAATNVPHSLFCYRLTRLLRGKDDWPSVAIGIRAGVGHDALRGVEAQRQRRSEEHTSELQSLMRISYAVFCLKKKP